MTDDEFRVEWMKLCDQYAKYLDNPRQRSIIQKRLDILWKRFERSQKC